MVTAMDEVGVDGAIFISAFSMYRYDASYAVEVQRAHPDRFAIVKPVDPDDPAVDDIIGLVGRHPSCRNSALSEPRHFNLLEPNVGPLTRCRGDALTRSKRLGSSMFDVICWLRIVICWLRMMVRLAIPRIAAITTHLF
jgi:hypothetical protein